MALTKITSNIISDSAINTSKLADNSISTNKLASSVVTPSKINGRLYSVTSDVSIADGLQYSVGQVANNIQSIVVINQTSGQTHTTFIPLYGNGGGGVNWTFTYLDPDTGWTINTGGASFTFAHAGSSPNTYTCTITGGGGAFVIQRTSGSNSYRVRILNLNFDGA